MTDPTDPFDNLDTEAVCRCPSCIRRDQTRWPDWAAPRADWRPVEVVKISGGRL